MSELKAHRIIGLDGRCNSVDNDYYLKSEADKVIKDIVEGAMSMFREANRCRGLDTKSQLGRIADVAFKHWNHVEHTMSNNRQLRLDKAILLRLNEDMRTRLNSEMSRRVTDKLEYNLNIRHQKYKRCLAMAMWCASRSASWCLDPADEQLHKSDFYDKWKLRWLELADKFKEAK